MTAACVIQASPQMEVIMNMHLCRMNQSIAEERVGGRSLGKRENIGQHLLF